MMKTICSGRHENCPDAPEQSVFLATGKERNPNTEHMKIEEPS
jgi:hypothetical protein